ncbi:cytochrome c oxidase assembly protein COX11, mitochondrial [Odontomachus brunneus]|uniref:cytochrome c oxidase assembly protein COX11, mitochondrial n=1 Tax=Odontomachus brunneus TaxID=486640 RepID=UPI0013F289F3|nr:cytochrome c oxidase assembly protein COX11, mitochondrial [Odontomachus brunneus]XP_032662706.1 cytochrome c oxidase assembly protein COX11, mitochondrial [Odontomachus brunneus]
MYFNFCQRLTRTCTRQIYTSVSQNLMKSHSDNLVEKKLRSTALYWTGLGVLVVGLSYSAVPLYRMFCQAYSYGGTIKTGHDTSKVSTMSPVKNRKIKIKFTADIAASMQWHFKPQQMEITVVPGETALAFYTATNPTDTQIIGISTYNVVPFEVGQYFNKIQCFCFEEQMLNPHEQVDMPVFFYIDPEFAEDPKMEFTDEIILSYTFFEAKPGFELPVPSYVKSHLTK